MFWQEQSLHEQWLHASFNQHSKMYGEQYSSMYWQEQSLHEQWLHASFNQHYYASGISVQLTNTSHAVEGNAETWIIEEEKTRRLPSDS